MAAVISVVAFFRSSLKGLKVQKRFKIIWPLNICITFVSFLAVLDHVSRAHEVKIRPSSVRPSVRRPFVASISSKAIAWISFKFWFLLSLGHMPRYFLNFKKKWIFTNIFRFVNTLWEQKIQNATPPSNYF